jgi:hypothetical protein
MTHNRESIWRTADGRLVMLKDMEDSHVVNIINWINDNSKSYPAGSVNRFIAEARYRQTILFAEGKPYPQQVGTVWKLVDPETGEGRIEPPPAEYIEAVKDNPGYQQMFKSTQEKRKRERL